MIIALTGVLDACAGGLVGSKEKKLAYFDNLERDTLASLIKEQPRAKPELADSVGYLVAKQKIVKVSMYDRSGGGTGVLVEKRRGSART